MENPVPIRFLVLLRNIAAHIVDLGMLILDYGKSFDTNPRILSPEMVKA